MLRYATFPWRQAYEVDPKIRCYFCLGNKLKKTWTWKERWEMVGYQPEPQLEPMGYLANAAEFRGLCSCELHWMMRTATMLASSRLKV